MVAEINDWCDYSKKKIVIKKGEVWDVVRVFVCVCVVCVCGRVGWWGCQGLGVVGVEGHNRTCDTPGAAVGWWAQGQAAGTGATAGRQACRCPRLPRFASPLLIDTSAPPTPGHPPQPVALPVRAQGEEEKLALEAQDEADLEGQGLQV